MLAIGTILVLFSVNAPAIDGRANKRVIEFLSEALQILKSKIVLRKGLTSPVKCLDIDLDEEKVIRALEIFSAKNKR